MNRKKDLLSYALNLDCVVAGLAFVVLVIVTFAGVIMRYVFKSPFSWMEEVQLFCFVWMSFMGGCVVFRQGNHICIDVLVDIFPKGMQKAIEIAVSCINVAVLIYLFFKGCHYVQQMQASARITNILQIPYSFIYGILPAGCILMILNQFIYLFRNRKEEA